MSRRTLGFVAMLTAASLVLPAGTASGDEHSTFGKRHKARVVLSGEADTPRGQRMFFCSGDVRKTCRA